MSSVYMFLLVGCRQVLATKRDERFWFWSPDLDTQLSQAK